MTEVLLVLLGFFLGWLVTHVYSMRASEDAERLSQASREELQTIARAFARLAEDQKLVEWTRDSEGRITWSKVIRRVMTDAVSVTDESSASVGVSAKPAEIAGSGQTRSGSPPASAQ